MHLQQKDERRLLNRQKQIEYHFNHYKDLKKPGSTEVKSFDGLEEAKEVIKAAIERFKKK